MHTRTKITKNSAWETWGSAGLVCGFLLFIVGIVTQILEFPRVYNGATNLNVNMNMTDSLYLISNYYQHWWPWTYPASLFGLFTFFTGIMGILAGIRGTYTSILGFFTMSVVSATFAIYLIVYFAFIVSFYRSMGKDRSSQRTAAESVSYGLASTQIVVAIINIVLCTISAVLAGRAIALCVGKGISNDEPVFFPARTPLPPRAYQTNYSQT